MKGVAEGHELRQSGLAQFGDWAEEARDEVLAVLHLRCEVHAKRSANTLSEKSRLEVD